MKKLPIGIQTFADIIQGHYLYVDKTELVSKMVEGSKGYYFLARPRRFGKTLFLDTLKTLFEGRKELFKNLSIYDKWNWDITYPVIHIDFAIGVLKTEEDFQLRLRMILQENQQHLDVECAEAESSRECFRDLIIKSHKKYGQKVVVLIDEYDKPMLDNISDPEICQLIRDKLRDIYSVIKGTDPYLRFVFFTGVSKFSKVSIFSGLNTLEDISLDTEYATVCGYTENDLDTGFADHLYNVDRKQLQKWYNGYNFLGEKVYNPFDILLFISKGCRYQNYWFSTGTPSFLMQLISDQQYYIPDLENLIIDPLALEAFDINQMPLEVVMFQAGYLTIKKAMEKREVQLFQLDFPNFEVQNAFHTHLLGFLTNDSRKSSHQMDLLDALYEANLAALQTVIYSLFEGISYHNYQNNPIQNYEGYYASVLYAYFKSSGEELIAEDTTRRGRIDLTLKINGKIFIFEFKVVDKKHMTNKALQQIKEKQYADKYRNQGEIYLVGIEFSRQDRNVCGFEWERVELTGK